MDAYDVPSPTAPLSPFSASGPAPGDAAGELSRRLGGFVCPNPFLYAELRQGGDVSPCCYLNQPLGNLGQRGLKEIWTSPEADSLRASVLDGSYRFCDPARCAGMQKALAADARAASPYQTPYELLSRERAARLAWMRPWLEGARPVLPRIVSLDDDPSCNLSCPSCRQAPIVLPREESDGLGERHAAVADALAREGGGELWLCGSGDPFASRCYRAFLTTFDPAARPGVRLRIDTNGVLLTPDMWQRTLGRYADRVGLLAVSVDAAEADTYARLRRGGDWARLCDNLAFLGRMRARHPNLRFLVRMIVQKDNFRQMPAFAALARRFNADLAVFSALDDWGSHPRPVWESLAVHRAEHPLRGELLAVLADPVLHAPGVDLGNLTRLARSARTPQAEASPHGA